MHGSVPSFRPKHPQAYLTRMLLHILKVVRNGREEARRRSSEVTMNEWFWLKYYAARLIICDVQVRTWDLIWCLGCGVVEMFNG